MAQQIPSPASQSKRPSTSVFRRIFMIPVFVFMTYLLFKYYVWVTTPAKPQIIYADRSIPLPPTLMEGSSLPQSTTPDAHPHPPRPYDPNVASASAPAPAHQTTPDPDHSMDWQDVSFMSNEADEVIPEDEDEAAYKRRKARERQRRKRMRDRANGIGRNGQPATPRRYPGTDVGQFEGTNPFADPPPDPAALAAMTPDEVRKEKMRRAARERQRKHRAVVRARRAEDEARPPDVVAATITTASASASGAPSGIQEGAMPVTSDSVGEIEQEVNPGEPHPVPYEQQPPTFAYYPPPMWPGNPFAPGQFFHPHHPHHPAPFVQNGQMMPPPHMVPILAPHQQQPPPQTMNPMQMQVSPAPPSPRPPETPADVPTPSPASAAAPALEPPPTPPTPAPALPPVPAPAATSSAAPPPPAPAPAPAPLAPVLAPTAPLAQIPMGSLMSMAAPLSQPPPPSHTPGQVFAMVLTLALNSTQSQLLRAHIMQQLRLTPVDLTELEGVIARAFDVWDRERGGDPSNQLPQAAQAPGALSTPFHYPPPSQPAQPPPHTPATPSQPPPQAQPAQEAPHQTHASVQHSPQARAHPPPSTPQSQPRPPRTSTNRRALGVGQSQVHSPLPSQSGGTLNVPRPVAGRSVSVGGVSVRNPGLGPTPGAVVSGPPSEQNQRSVSHPQRHPHAGLHQQRSASVATLPVTGQKRSAPGSHPQPPPPSQPQSAPPQPRPSHPLQQQSQPPNLHSSHSVPVPPAQARPPPTQPSTQARSQTLPSPQIQTRPQPQQQSRPGSQPQTPVMGPTSGGSGGNKGGSGSGVLSVNAVLGHGPPTLASDQALAMETTQGNPLFLPDILNLICDLSDSREWLSLMLTCRAIFPIVAPYIWGTVDFQNLTELMKLKVSEQSTVVTAIDYTRFDIYAPFVKNLAVYGRTCQYFRGELRNKALSRALKEPLLPNMTSMTMYISDLQHDADSLIWIELLLSPSLTMLRFEPDSSASLALLSYPATRAVIRKLVSTCRNIKELVVYPGDIAKDIPDDEAGPPHILWIPDIKNSFVTLTHLCDITSSIMILDGDGLAVLGGLPRLECLALYGNRGDPKNLETHVSEGFFPMLSGLTLINALPTTITKLFSIKPMVRQLTWLSVSQAYSGRTTPQEEAWLADNIPRLMKHTTHLKRFAYDAGCYSPSLRRGVFYLKRTSLLDSMSSLPLEFVSLSGLSFPHQSFLSHMAAAWPRLKVLLMPNYRIPLEELHWFSRIPQLNRLALQLSFFSLPTNWDSSNSSIEILEEASRLADACISDSVGADQVARLVVDLAGTF
ncbi:hypothetical protein CTheo_4290 [Ceratobasidium theobromae]|uniref:Uncharacterized protein n=1 Tax=Ceratobasidium theobromae TaxID=1582974 RepID=A0A5N5QKH1_9AGAM|nr:hypothetical protein CTheo_4290 [Ceratobasidium theobromae]